MRECLELILMLADALKRNEAAPPVTDLQNSHPATPQVAPVEHLGSDSLKQFAIDDMQLGDVGNDVSGLGRRSRA
jgi:hypothetical protein